MMAAKGGLFLVWAGSSSHHPHSNLGMCHWLPAALHCPPMRGENEPFWAQKCSRCLENLLSTGTACHRLTQQLIFSCPCDISCADAAKSWCSLQQLHTAVHPRNITGCYLLREGSIMQVKPLWARRCLALTVFVLYRTTKWGGGWNKFCKCDT